MPPSSVEKLQADILMKPPTKLLGTFDSVAANFLLHRLYSDSLLDKKSAVASCSSLLREDGGVFFGSTILGRDLLDDAVQAGPPPCCGHDPPLQRDWHLWQLRRFFRR